MKGIKIKERMIKKEKITLHL